MKDAFRFQNKLQTLMGTAQDILSSSRNITTIPAQTESKKLEFLLCEDTGHLALFRVHFQLQPAFQILPAGFQQTLCCTLAFGKGKADASRFVA